MKKLMKLIRRMPAVLIAAILICLSFTPYGVMAADGATLHVTNLKASGNGSLRAALANAGNGDTIVFIESLEGSLSLAELPPVSTEVLTICGPVDEQGVPKVVLTGENRNGGLVFIGTRLNMVGIAFQDFTKSALEITSGDLSGCIFEGNTGKTGGAISASGNLFLADCTFSVNASDEHGGAVFSRGQVQTVGCFFDGNTAGGRGGAIYAGQDAVLDSTTFEHNTAKSGGAILTQKGLADNQSKFLENHAQNDGGAIYTGGDSILTGTVFEKNSAVQNGGGFFSVGLITIEDCQFTKNTAHTGGGGYGWTANITGGLFEENEAELSGGGYYAEQPEGTDSTTVTKATFTNNKAYKDGGGLFAVRDVGLSDCTFKKNAAEIGRGGGVFSVEGTATIAQCTFYNNQAGGNGGALAGKADLTIADSLFSGNQAGYGGAVDLDAKEESGFYIENSVFYKNSAKSGAAFRTVKASAYTINTTLYGNSATDDLGVVLLCDGDNYLYQSTLYNNTGILISGVKNYLYNNILMAPEDNIPDIIGPQESAGGAKNLVSGNQSVTALQVFGPNDYQKPGLIPLLKQGLAHGTADRLDYSCLPALSESEESAVLTGRLKAAMLVDQQGNSRIGSLPCYGAAIEGKDHAVSLSVGTATLSTVFDVGETLTLGDSTAVVTFDSGEKATLNADDPGLFLAASADGGVSAGFLSLSEKTSATAVREESKTMVTLAPDRTLEYGEALTVNISVEPLSPNSILTPRGQVLIYRQEGESQPVLMATLPLEDRQAQLEIPKCPAGIYTITAQYRGSDFFTASYGSASVIVNKRPLTVLAQDYDRTVGADNPDFALVYSGFLTSEDENMLQARPSIMTLADTNSPMGIYDITPTGGKDPNYDLRYANGTLTVTMDGVSLGNLQQLMTRAEEEIAVAGDDSRRARALEAKAQAARALLDSPDITQGDIDRTAEALDQALTQYQNGTTPLNWILDGIPILLLLSLCAMICLFITSLKKIRQQ